jgi:hypothetical protein
MVVEVAQHLLEPAKLMADKARQTNEPPAVGASWYDNSLVL